MRSLGLRRLSVAVRKAAESYRMSQRRGLNAGQRELCQEMPRSKKPRVGLIEDYEKFGVAAVLIVKRDLGSQKRPGVGSHL